MNGDRQMPSMDRIVAYWAAELTEDGLPGYPDFAGVWRGFGRAEVSRSTTLLRAYRRFTLACTAAGIPLPEATTAPLRGA